MGCGVMVAGKMGSFLAWFWGLKKWRKREGNDGVSWWLVVVSSSEFLVG